MEERRKRQGSVEPVRREGFRPNRVARSQPGPTRARQPRRFLRSASDFEKIAADWLRYWGYEDVALTHAGADGGIDAEGARVAAQVKAWLAPIGRPLIQQLKGAALKKRAVFFSLSEYTPEAIAWANTAKVALFRFSSYQGDLEAVNRHAEGIREEGVTSAKASLETVLMKSAGTRTAAGTARFRRDIQTLLRNGTTTVPQLLRRRDVPAIGYLRVRDVIEVLPGFDRATAETVVRDMGLAAGARLRGLGRARRAELLRRMKNSASVVPPPPDTSSPAAEALGAVE